MNLAQTFEPARPLARHCEELTARGPRPEERAESLAGWRREIGRSLSQELGELFSGGRLAVDLGEPEAMNGKDVFARIGPVAVNSLLRCGEADQTLLLSFDYATAIALTDRSFGGDGEIADTPIETWPRSAALLVDQVATVIASAIAKASTADGESERTGDVIIRSESAMRLKPFGPETPCALIVLTLRSNDRREWRGLLSVPSERLDRLLPGLGAGAPSSAKRRGMSDRLAPPFSTIPLPLRAVLAEVSLSLSRLERLQPGDLIPIAVPRDVPLRIGSTTFAHGSVGTRQDQLALQVTRTAPGRAQA